MSDPKFFNIPRASLITLPKYFRLSDSSNIYVSFDQVRAWGYVPQDRGTVVTIDLVTPGDAVNTLEYASIIAHPGPWVDQLLNWTADNPAFGPVYVYDKRSSILDIQTTYFEVGRLITPIVPAGTYDFYMSTTWNYNQNNGIIDFRWSMDGGTNWSDLTFEMPGTVNQESVTYGYPYVIPTEGVQTIVAQAKKRTSSGTFNILYFDLVLELKLKA